MKTQNLYKRERSWKKSRVAATTKAVDDFISNRFCDGDEEKDIILGLMISFTLKRIEAERAVQNYIKRREAFTERGRK